LICYLDSSVVLRYLFQEPNPLKEWKKLQIGFSSQLLRLECLRTIDRLRLARRLSSQEVSVRLEGLNVIFSHLDFLPLTPHVLTRAEQSHPVPVGSLDSIHLATALLWREKHGEVFKFATHDEELGLAARAYGFETLGIDSIA